MEILDSEEDKSKISHSLLGNIGGFFYLIAGIMCLIGIYGSWLSYSSLQTSGAPDATQLSNGIRISLYSQLVALAMLILGLICQMTAFFKYDFKPKWIWKIMSITGTVAILSSIIPFNPITIILGIVILVHIFTKREFYQDNEVDLE